MDCEEQRKAYRECFMVRSDCRKELDNIFKCSYEKNYFPKPEPKNNVLLYERNKMPQLR
jgi:hypothetical protein